MIAYIKIIQINEGFLIKDFYETWRLLVWTEWQELISIFYKGIDSGWGLFGVEFMKKFLFYSPTIWTNYLSR